MRRAVLLVCVIVGFFTIGAMPASSVIVQSSVLNACTQRYSGGEFVPVAKQAWAERKWRDRTPVGPGLKVKSRTMRGCAVTSHARVRMRAIWRRYKSRFGLWRRYRLVAPEPGFVGEGRWLRWLPIPRYIIECETRGYIGTGRWLARNSSGADGPAQLLGHGEPYPALTAEQRVRYWEITRQLYLAEGSSPWACA